VTTGAAPARLVGAADAAVVAALAPGAPAWEASSQVAQ